MEYAAHGKKKKSDINGDRINTFFVQQRYGMVTPISLEWAGSSGMMSLIIIVRSGVMKRTIMTVLLCSGDRSMQSIDNLRCTFMCECSLNGVYMYVV